MMAHQLKIGFIGLGSLGRPIAQNILEKGHEIFVFNRTRSKSAAFRQQGAVVAESVEFLAKQVDVVFTMVSDDVALRAVVQDENGLLQHLKAGSTHISMSTILPQTAEELALMHGQREQHYLAAPVFGRPETAVARKLNFVISGEEKIRKLADPLLKDAGAIAVWDFGDRISASNIVKLCGNFMIAAALEAMGESITLAKKSGVDARLMWDMFTQTLFNSPIYANYGNIILQEKFEPAAFTAILGLKDMNLVLEQAASVNQSMPLAKLLKNNLQQLVEQGKDQVDWSAIFLAAQKN